MGSQLIARKVTGTDANGPINRIETLHRNHLNEIGGTDTFYPGSGGRGSLIRTYQKPFTSGGTDQFLGQKDYPESELKDFGARYYQYRLSRWTSPDSILSHPYDPLSLNKYAYVRNDPVNLVDPDGRKIASFSFILTWFTEAGFTNVLYSGYEAIPDYSSPGDYSDSDPSYRREDRAAVVDQAINDAGKRLLNEQCNAFVQSLINSLRKYELLSDGIKTPADLLGLIHSDQVTKVYGGGAAVDPRLNKGTGVGASTKGNTVYFGEDFYDDTWDKPVTTIHESFHLGIVSKSGNGLDDVAIAKMFNNVSVLGGWGAKLKTACKEK
jgi:RHS repeat-associated protein